MSSLINFVEYWDAVWYHIFNLFGWKGDSTTRVAAGGWTQYKPKSVYKLYKEFSTKTSAVKTLPWNSPLLGTLIVLIECTITQPGTTQCYDNIWADLTLNGGDPGYSSIFGYYDLYTWNGWLELLWFWIWSTAWYTMFDALAVATWVAINWLFLQSSPMPLCKSGEFDIFGVDCASVSAFYTYF